MDLFASDRNHIGDPRDPSIDLVDWIESVPYSETRNYIQRVLEGLEIYRGRMDATKHAAWLDAAGQESEKEGPLELLATPLGIESLVPEIPEAAKPEPAVPESEETEEAEAKEAEASDEEKEEEISAFDLDDLYIEIEIERAN